MRWLVLMAGVIAGAQPAHAADRELTITMATPASVQLTLWCAYSDKGCGQAAADAAQERCQKSRRDAQLSESDVIERELLSGRQKFGYRFRCVN